jgi:hypothetical protein
MNVLKVRLLVSSDNDSAMRVRHFLPAHLFTTTVATTSDSDIRPLVPRVSTDAVVTGIPVTIGTSRTCQSLRPTVFTLPVAGFDFFINRVFYIPQEIFS